MPSTNSRSLIFAVLMTAAAGALAGRAAADAAPLPDIRIEDYLPTGAEYDESVPVPSSVLGFEVGEWHVRHDQLVAYLERLAASSERVRLEVIGRTHERRPLLQLTLSAPARLAAIDEIRREHLRSAATGAPWRPDAPVVVYLGYSVHGNEASGSNAALLVAYHLAAARGPEVEDLLAGAVVLLDPSLNPDGLARFAQWANQHRGRVPVGDAAHREHLEGWPNGRTNHYWFDLNRDWLLARHPETVARLEQFHRWRPNVVADFHEMAGPDRTYFFQPGVPSRQNPWTPAANLELTRRIAAYHAGALDDRGRLFYSGETYDDFYLGKGSTYPDVQGAVGILFEQASVRGRRLDSATGPLTFPFAISNQVVTSLSTLRASSELRRDLLEYQARSVREALDEAAADEIRAWVVGDLHDRVRNVRLVELLRRHRIEVRELARPIEIAGDRFEPGRAWLVPQAQPQYRLVKAVFETRSEFADTTFYDVSTWTLPLSFGLPYAALDRRTFDGDLVGPAVEAVGLPAGEVVEVEEPAVAYLFRWDGYRAPAALYSLLENGLRARVATRPFRARTARGIEDFGAGTIAVPVSIQSGLLRPGQAGPERPSPWGEAGTTAVSPASLKNLLLAAAAAGAVEILATADGLTAEGIDLGSPSWRNLDLPRPALLVGRGVETYEAGEIWHLLDHRFGVPVTLIDREDLRDFDLAAYTHLLLPGGEWEELPPEVGSRIRRWIQDGGVAVGLKEGAVGLRELVRGGSPEPPAVEISAEEPAVPERRPYSEHEKDRAAQKVTGAIFEVELDLTHPIAFGYRRSHLPVFRNSALVLEPSADPYATVARYGESPLLSGYVSEENLDRISGSPAIVAERVGPGVVVLMVDDPNFRGIWYGTEKLFLNALFFGTILDETGPALPPVAGR